MQLCMVYGLLAQLRSRDKLALLQKKSEKYPSAHLSVRLSAICSLKGGLAGVKRLY